ncbi:serine/threonine-protein kinase MEC1 [Candida albicans P75010]|nr:serine/threonine-protein kinase MEC1 [Candida albicans P75010]
MTSNQSISTTELLQFLTDIETNIDDHETDFRKLLLYLLRFTNEKLIVIAQEENKTPTELQLLSKLIDTIELVLSKKTPLLSTLLTIEDVNIIHTTGSGSLVYEVPLHEWCISFALSHIPNFVSHTAGLNQLKRLVFLIVNLVSTQLHSFKVIKSTRIHLLKTLDDNLNFCLQNLLSANTFLFKSKLTTAVNLFSIVHDYDISQKLSLNLNNYQLKFESCSRKIWFILNEISLVSELDNLNLLDCLKSVFILDQSSALVLNVSVGWNQIGFLLSCIVEYLQQDFRTLDSNTNNFEFVNLNRSISLSLLNVYIVCFDKDLLENFMSFSNIKGILSKLIYDDSIPSVIRKTLNIVQYTYQLMSNPDGDDIKLYSTSVYNDYVWTPFVDSELESLRARLLDLQGNHEDSRKEELLSFSIDETHKLAKSTNSLNYTDEKAWIRTVKKLIGIDKNVLEDETTLYTLVTALSHYPCILKGDYDYTINECTKCGFGPLTKNNYSSIDPNRFPLNYSTEATTLQDIIQQFLIPKLETQQDSLLCCNTLLLIFNFYASFSPMADMQDHNILDFLLRLLATNDNRDVRMLVARILPLYLIQQKDDKLLDETFKYIFQKVTSIDFSSQNRLHFGESTIRAVVELATVSTGERLCAIYFKLVDWLGEQNEQHSNYVYCGILNLASAKSLPPHKLLSPYLPSVAEIIIKKPQVFERIIKVSMVTKNYFLNRTKEYTVPRILEYYKDPTLLSQIANAAGLEVGKLLANCLPRILATYLTKESVNERYIMKVLSSVCPDYKMIHTEELFTRIGDITWYILLEIQMDEFGNIRNLANITRALECVCKNVSLRKNGSELTKNNSINDLIEDQVLLLVQKFSDVTHSSRGAKPYLELKNSFYAIEFLIKGHIDAITSALGQLSTCLQATLEEPDFHVLSLRCWNELIKKVPPSHLISLIDIIISIILQKFESFGSEAKSIAIEILRKIYEEIKDKYNRYSLYFLSLPFLSYMEDYQMVKEFRNMKSPSRAMIFSEFTRRLQTSNMYVVKHALFDLSNYFEKYQINCQKDLFKDPGLTPAITSLVRTILDTAAKFKNKDTTVSTACAKALAIIGALDSNKFQFKSVKQLIIISSDFEDIEENSTFLVDLIENHLLKIFWASNDPHKQLFAAYVMQSFLAVMGLDERVLNTKDNRVWNKFTDVAKSTLTPFLKSKYAAPKPKLDNLKFPFFKLGMKYETWLVDITLFLLKRASIDNIKGNQKAKTRKLIFQSCAVLIQREHDIPLCEHLLRYVALSHVINEGVPEDLHKEFLHILKMDSKSTSPDRAEQLKLCYQAIFSVLDYFNQWVSNMRVVTSNSGSELTSSDIRHKMDAVAKFSSFPQDLLTTRSAECDAYERTIMYLENCYRDSQSEKSFKLSNLNGAATLQDMYAHIDDYDALNGTLKMFSTNNLNEKLTTFQYSDSWSLAHESFEALGSTKDSVSNNTKLLQSLNEHGLYNEVLSTLSARTDSNDLKSIPLDWSLMGLHAAVYKGDSKQLEKWLQVTNSIGKPHDMETMINYELAKALSFLFQSRIDMFKGSLDKLYNIIGCSLVPSVSSNFTRNITLMNQLHAIYDVSLIVLSQDSEDTLDLRIGNVDQDFDTQRNILTLHNVANTVMKNPAMISKNLLRESSLARKYNRLDISTRSIVQAMSLEDDQANIEFAELQWAQGKQSEAIKCLFDILKDNKFHDDKSKAKVQLQYANWLDESNHLSAHQIITEYNKAFHLNMVDEKCNFDIGKYYNKLMESSNDESGEYEHLTVRNYIRAVSVGTTYIFEALPKVLTIWLDFADKSNKSNAAENRLKQIIDDLYNAIANVPNYSWYTVLTQILSRIVHEHEPSFKVLKRIVQNVTLEYPKHCVWYIFSHARSSDKVRKRRVRELLNQVCTQDGNDTLPKSTIAAGNLFAKLIKIAELKIPKTNRKRQMSLLQDFEVDLSEPIDDLVIPIQSNLQIQIPSHLNSKHKGFSRSSSISFDGFDDNVNIFFSLQMPRQLTVRGSDGNAYRLMVKSDDTRKDAKVVEFTTMVNRILSTSTEARKRGLQIANYSVVPLSDHFGIIEFVMNVQTMKGVISEQRKRQGIPINERKVFMHIDSLQKAKKKDSKQLDKLVAGFRAIMDRCPPVLHTWFVEQFSDPSAWYMARNAFTRSSAVMSMVGYIMGLGDRHCENILIFKNTGAVLHIDFDCLFEKGTTLPTPEIVPFRLTQNMVDAMGITGVDGIYRITCEVTGTLLRENEQILMNILETLIYDPLIDWRNHNPREDLSKVRKKIRGLINEDEGLPMNIHGQVDVLIQEATSLERLSQMYAGWAAYM